MFGNIQFNSWKETRRLVLCRLGRGASFGMSCSCSGCMFSLGLSSSDSIDGNNVEFSENKKVNMYITRNINIVEYRRLGKLLSFIMI